MKIGVAGLGVVGGALATYLENTKASQDILLKYDPPKGFEDDLSQCDFVFICVPAATEVYEKWPVDLKNIVDVLYRFGHAPTYFVRSTVVPGSCERLRSSFKKYTIHSMPEFVSEKTAVEDMGKMPIITSYDNMIDVRYLFPGATVFHREPSACEMIKYAHNVHGAVKVAYFNIIHGLCSAEGIEYNELLEPLMATGHIDGLYTKVPGPDGKLGFGGGCFPKDVLAFREYIRLIEHHYDDHYKGSAILREILDYNKNVRGK